MTRVLTKYLAGAAALLSCAATSAQAAIIWNWSFDGEEGTFTTNGTAPGGVAGAGTYTLTDFAVTNSGAGNPVGSLLGGAYFEILAAPYSFSWNGSSVTAWQTGGPHQFLYFVSSTSSVDYMFGWNGMAFVPDSGFSSDEGSPLAAGPLALSVASTLGSGVPEPQAWAMLLAGFAIAGSAVRRRNVKVQFA